jgi:hypothetical protein
MAGAASSWLLLRLTYIHEHRQRHACGLRRVEDLDAQLLNLFGWLSHNLVE